MKISKEKISIIKIIISNNDDAVNIDLSQQQKQKKHNDDIDSDDRCSPPQKRKRFFNKTKKKNANKHPTVDKWKNSAHESFWGDGETTQKRNQGTEHSSGFVVGLKNTKSQQSKLHLVNISLHLRQNFGILQTPIKILFN